MKRLGFCAFVIIVCLFCATGLGAQQSIAGSTPAASASVPRLIKFSGVLNDLAGKPLSGPVEAVFSVYQNESDAEPLWQETQTVQADTTGRYTVLLGAMSEQGLPVELFTSGEARWLGVAAGKLPEQPRVLLVSVPYALEAGDAATLGGKPASAYLLSQSGVGATVVVPQAGGATVAGAPSQTSPAVTTPTPRTVGSSSAGSQNYVAKWTDSSNDLGNSLLFDNGTNVGINTTTPGTLNGTYFPAVMFQASQTSASSYLTADTSLAGGYAGLLLNRGGASANNRLWSIDSQPVASNTSSRLAFSTYTDAGSPTPVLTMLRTGNVGIGTSTPGTVNGTFFPSLLLQAAQSTASTYLTADTELAGGYAGLLLNRGAATANNRLWAMENQPSASNTSSQFAISAYSDAGMPTALLTILRSGKVGIGTTTPAATLEVNGTAQFDSAVTFANSQTFPGTGTVTSITAGTGLTGGTITTSGTLAVDTTVVPELGLSNLFATDQYIDGGYLDVYGVGDSPSLYCFNNSTDSTHPTLYLENDDSTSAGDLVFEAVGSNYGGQCTIDVSGNLFCDGTLSLAVKTVDQRQVGLYAVQSSENWIEDFGSGALVNGVARVNIDPQFARTVTADASYHVFLTPNGDCEGLYVTQKSAGSFEVHELKGGQSNVQFDYRIVAHRKGYETARLPDLTTKFQRKVRPPATPKASLAKQH